VAGVVDNGEIPGCSQRLLLLISVSLLMMTIHTNH